jgi:tetratricopeptide (TPR) repeat protein
MTHSDHLNYKIPVQFLNNNFSIERIIRTTVCTVALLLLTNFAVYAQDEEPREAIRISPAEYAQKLRLAEVYEENHDATNAVRVYGELFTLNPSDQNVFEGYTRALLVLKRYDEAERIVDQRLKQVGDRSGGSLDVLLLSAQLEARMNKRNDALDRFSRAEQLVNAKDCAALFPILYSMMDVSYNEDALALLDKMRKLSAEDEDVCSSQIAGLYLRLGEFDRASKEFIAILKSGEGNVGMVEQRLAQYITDSLSRSTVLTALETEIRAVPKSRANLRLLAWLYGERKDYEKALATIITLDDLSDAGPGDVTGRSVSEGPELLQFADRARSEGSLGVAAKAYTEAIKRLKRSGYRGQNYFIEQAELGALKTWESYYLSAPHLNDSIVGLVAQYESFAAEAKENGFANEALVRAGELSYSQLFDLVRATKDFEAAFTNSHGLRDAAREAAFGLVGIAYSSHDFVLASSRLKQIEDLLSSSPPAANVQEARNRVAYNRALGFYYRMNFDSAMTLLSAVASDASSDYANDAIELSGIIEESIKPAGKPSLMLYAKAALAEKARDYDEAESAYRAIIDSQINSPLADEAAIRSADMLVKLGRPADAAHELESMQEKMPASPLLDVAAFREAEIVEREIHDKARAEKMYEDYLERYPTSNFINDARDRARKLRGDVF